jgi:hypothetical protein
MLTSLSGTPTCVSLQGDDAVNGVRAENRELTLVVTAEVDQPTPSFSRTRERDLMEGAKTGPVLVLEEHHRLAVHGRRQAKRGEVDHFAGCR